MRLPTLPGLLLLVACAEDGAPKPLPPDAARPAAAHAAPAPATADPGLLPVAARALATPADEGALARLAERPEQAVACLFAAAADAGPVEQGRAPVLAAGLGAAALPGLRATLSHDDARQRRMALLAIAQLGRTAEPLAADLAAARQDQDLQVRALAEHAWKRAVGDTTDLDRSRTEHDAAVKDDR